VVFLEYPHAGILIVLNVPPLCFDKYVVLFLFLPGDVLFLQDFFARRLDLKDEAIDRDLTLPHTTNTSIDAHWS